MRWAAVMSLLQFPAPARFPGDAEVRLSDALRAQRELPAWIHTEGYRPVGFRRPQLGEYFFCPVRGKVIRCAEDIETHAFTILEYGG